MIPRSLAACAGVIALCGCFNPSAYMPMITGVSSGNNVVSGVPTGATSASVGGALFSPGVTVYWNGKAVPTTFKTFSSLQIALSPEQTDVAGKAQVTAANDGGMLSKPVTVTVFDAPLTATGLDPAQAEPGSGALTLTVTGSGFTPASAVLWNGGALTTTFKSSSSLSAAVPAALLAVAGEGFVQVANAQCAVGPVGPCNTSRPVLSFRVGSSSKSQVAGGITDMVWDATHALLFVASGATIAALDPASGAYGAQATLSSVQLSISAQDVYLYTAVQSTTGTHAIRLSLPGLTNPTQVVANANVDFIAASPDVPETAAFSGFGSGGILDGTVIRGQLVSLPTPFAWGFDSSTLFSVTSQFLLYQVGAGGLSAPVMLGPGGITGSLHYDRTARLLYDDSGRVFDELGVPQAGFTLPVASCKTAMDGAAGRMFAACAEDSWGLTVRSFDLASRQLRSRVLLEPPDYWYAPPAVALPVRIVRFGANGLAVSSFGLSNSIDSLHLYSGAFVH